MVFVVTIFFLKTTTQYKNETQTQQTGLAYDNTAVGDLVNKDSNHNGIPDWQENLLSPNSITTTNDINSADLTKGNENTSNSGEKNLTQTDQFSRELFATVASLNQAGPMDQNTADKLSSSLADKIQNPVVRKVFLISDLKVKNSDNTTSIQNYSNDIDNLYAKYPIKGNVIDILNRFTSDGQNIDLNVLSELDPIITQTQNLIDGMMKMDVPSVFLSPHLDVMNALERLIENLDDIKLFDTDPIVAMGAMSKYNENATSLKSAIDKLITAIDSKLSN